MKKRIAPKARKENLVVQELDGEVLIYDLNTNKAVCLNETSVLVWQACDGIKDVSEIRDLLGKQLKSPVNDDFVWLALDQLKEENLIENTDELETKFAGVSRREVIRKIGLGSMVALPIVASLIAPLAAHANSRCVTGGTCICDNTNGDIGICSTSGTGGVACADTNCRCSRNSLGRANGICAP